MTSKNGRIARISAVGAGMALGLLTLTACTGTVNASGSLNMTGATTSAVAAQPAGPAATGTRKAARAVSGSATPTLSPALAKFAGTQPFVLLNGYDSTNQLVEFVMAVKYPAPPGGHGPFTYDFDKKDPAVHKLALSANPEIDSDGTLCRSAPNAFGGRVCTTAQLITYLRHMEPTDKYNPIQLTVDRSGQISKVAEQSDGGMGSGDY
jgi:hypothetical protein